MKMDSPITDSIVEAIYAKAETITNKVVKTPIQQKETWTNRIDNIVTSRALGFPLMLALLCVVFWITITGANAPSEFLARFLFMIEDHLTAFFSFINSPSWLHGLLVLGMYRALAWVVSVMLPPMAIFFPIFTLLEDLGYLPRIAFNLDHMFQRVGAHGKQALTMAMGFGCNAAGVIAARIIDSPRERLVAIVTNNFVPCNGRFPILITMAIIVSSLTIRSAYQTVMGAVIVLAGVLIGILATFLVSWGLTNTILQGEPSFFILELPPYRKPQVGKVIVRSFFDRTIFVLTRAVIVAAPAGALTWLLANIKINQLSLITHLSTRLDPFGKIMGLDGVILLAFILGLPANEIVIPIMLMSYLSAGAMLELESLDAIRELLTANGWTWLTAVNFIIFSLLHFPCGTTLLTIHKETGSWKWTALSAVIPTVLGIIICIIITQITHLFLPLF